MTRRLLSLSLCLGLVPFVVGCDETVKADAANKPDEKANADSTPPGASKKSKAAPPEFSDLPANDPLVASAIQAREQVTELEEELLRQLDDLRTALVSAKADPERLRESALQFLEVTKTMRQKTHQANEAVNTVGEKTAELSRSSRHLASSYRALAGLFRKKARDYSEKKLRDQLLGFAKDYDDIAASIPERCKALDAVHKKLPALKRKVQEVHSFLTDAVSFLQTHPGLGAAPRDTYSAEFESFAVTFSEWIRVLDDLRNALRERAVSQAIRESYRREVVAMEKREVAKRDEEARALGATEDVLARAERAERDEEARLVKLAAVEQAKPKIEREPPAKVNFGRALAAKVEVPPAPPPLTPVVIRPSRCSQPVTYYLPPCPPPCVCQPVLRPCRVRLVPVFRRG